MKKMMCKEDSAEMWWEATVQQHAARDAVFFMDGSPWGTFGDMHHWIRKHSTLWSEKFQLHATHSAKIVCSICAPAHPTWPAALMTLWKCGATVLLLPSVSRQQREEIECTAGANWRLEGSREGNWTLHRLQNSPVVFPWDADLLKVTSGSTGTPRLIGFTSEQLRADAAQILKSMDIRTEDRNLGVIPFSHSYGLSNLITPLLFFGIPLVCAPDPLPNAIASALDKSGATVWPAVPAMFSPLLQLGYIGTKKLRTVISAGAPLPSSLAKSFAKQTGLRIHSFYGSSECGGICYDTSGHASEIEGWVGSPMPAVHLKEILVDQDTIGFEISGSAVGLGCFPEQQTDSLKNGIFSPLDILRRVQGGYCLIGRSDDLANLGGRKVHPAQVEATLSRVAGSNAIAVFKVPGRSGDELVAVVETTEPPKIAQLRQRAAGQLPSWQVPKHWHSIDKLPINERGKLSRRELAERWLQGRLS